MKKFKTTTAFILMLIMVIGTAAGCSKGGDDVSEDGVYKYNITMINPKDNIKDDAYWDYITEKFKVDFDVIGVSYENYAEKNRIWLSSGDMPDAMKWNFNYSDYLKYSSEGVVKKLPDDYATKYPNLTSVMQKTGALEKLQSVNNGGIYAFMPNYGFGDQYYEEGYSMNVDLYAVAYRKDWAKQLGIEVGSIIDYDDLIDMAKKFKEADLGGVGQDNTVGIAVTQDEAPNIFVALHNSYYQKFHKVDGKYVYGLLEDSTLEGVKEYAKAYKEGILHPNFFVHKMDNIKSLFVSGKAGLYYENFKGVSAFTNLKTTFQETNPGIDPNEALGLCWIKAPDGKIHGQESANFWECTYYNPKMSDAKFDRLLTLVDYLASNETAIFRAYGFEGVDYEKEGDTYKRLIEPDEDGNYKVTAKYPSMALFGALTTPNFTNKEDIPKDTADPYTVKVLNELGRAKLSGEGDFAMQDFDVNFYTSDTYSKFLSAQSVNTILSETIMSEDIEGTWKSKMAEISDTAHAVEQEMNDALIK